MAKFVFTESFGSVDLGGFNDSDIKTADKLKGIAVLLRDGCQNSKDRHLNNKEVTIRITLIELTSEKKNKFLKCFDWDNLKKHISASVTQGDKGNREIRHLENGLKEIDSKKPLRLLLLEDFDTQGLTGKEDDKKSNYYLLLRSEGRTSGDDGRGGSYGIGKKVLWNASSIRTVLFSSYPSDIPNNNKGLRLVGKSWLAGHAINNKEYQYVGIFGNEESNSESTSFKRGISNWNQKDMAKNLYLDRSDLGSTGTSALIVGFDHKEFETSEKNYLEKTAKSIVEEINKHFWPSLTKTFTCPVNFEIKIRKNDIITEYKKIVKPSENFKFYENLIKSEKFEKKATAVNEIARKNIKVKIPKRLVTIGEITKHDAFDHQALLSITRIPEELNDDSLSNKVAIFRGFGMVVRYLDIGTHLGNLPYVAALSVGTANGDSVDHKRAEDWFRLLEPALHDDWEPGSQITNVYAKGSKKSINGLWQSVRDEISKLTSEEDKEGDKGPALLSKLLSIGKGNRSSGGDSNLEFDGRVMQIWKTNDEIDIEFDVTRIKSSKKLIVKILYFLKAENQMSISDSAVPFKENLILNEQEEFKTSLDENNTFVLPAKINRFKFKGILDPYKLSKTNEMYKNYDFRKVGIKLLFSSSIVSEDK